MAKSNLSQRESLIKKASYLRIAATSLADNMKMGSFKSLYKGQGIEFSGVRDYIPGDDVRTIDWNVTARIGRPYIKIFNEERELQIFLIVDTSSSMFLKAGGKTKYEAAAEGAAILTIAAEINSCPVGAVLFDGDIHFSCKPLLSKIQSMSIISRLDKVMEQKDSPALLKDKDYTPVTGSVLGTALSGAAKLLKNKSLVFVFSDFRSSGWERPLISLGHKHNIVALRLTDSYDKSLPDMGTVMFQDVESSMRMELPSSSKKLKKEWEKFNEENISYWSDFCKKHGIMPVTFNAGQDALYVLNSVFSRNNRS